MNRQRFGRRQPQHAEVEEVSGLCFAVPSRVSEAFQGCRYTVNLGVFVVCDLFHGGGATHETRLVVTQDAKP